MNRTFYKGLLPFLLLFSSNSVQAQHSFNKSAQIDHFSSFKQTGSATKDREKRDRLKEQHLSRNFMDFGVVGISTVGMYSNVDKYYVDQYAGPQFKIGSTWHLIRGDFRGFLRVTWLRAGIIGGDGILLCSAPLHLGLGHNFLFSENFSIDLLASGGLLVIGPGFLDDYVELSYGLAPEIKFNVKKLVISAEYSLKHEDENHVFSTNPSNGEVSHFYAINLGFRF